jgi:hypothetical protein
MNPNTNASPVYSHSRYSIRHFFTRISPNVDNIMTQFIGRLIDPQILDSRTRDSHFFFRELEVFRNWVFWGVGEEV